MRTKRQEIGLQLVLALFALGAIALIIGLVWPDWNVHFTINSTKP